MTTESRALSQQEMEQVGLKQRIDQYVQMRRDVVVEQALLKEFEEDPRRLVVPLPGENEYVELNPRAEFGKLVAMRGREKEFSDQGIIFEK